MRKQLLDSSRNYPDRSTILSEERTELNVKELITSRYKETIAHNRARINATLMPLYQREIPFKESILTDVICNIQKIIDKTGHNIDELATIFRKRLGPISFFRKVGDKEVPIDSDRIIKAYHAITSKMPNYHIKDILYK